MIKCPLETINSFSIKRKNTEKTVKNNAILPTLDKELVFHVDGRLRGNFTSMNFMNYQPSKKTIESGISGDKEGLCREKFTFDRLYVRYTSTEESSTMRSSTS
jgi:hypothetical protein